VVQLLDDFSALIPHALSLPRDITLSEEQILKWPLHNATSPTATEENGCRKKSNVFRILPALSFVPLRPVHCSHRRGPLNHGLFFRASVCLLEASGWVWSAVWRHRRNRWHSGLSDVATKKPHENGLRSAASW